MEPRALAIPAAAVLGLSFAQGCSERISTAVGDTYGSGGTEGGETGDPTGDPTDTSGDPTGDPTDTSGDPTGEPPPEDLIVGRWNLQRMIYDYGGYGYVREFPYVYDEPGCYAKYGQYMQITPAFDGELVYYSELKCPDEFGYAYGYPLDVVVIDPGTHYRIEFVAYYDYQMDCHLSGDELDCFVMPFDGKLEMQFVRG